MKILHIIDDLTMGGGQNLLIGLAGAQVNRGHEVTVLQLKKSDDPTVTDKIEASGASVEWITTGSLYNPLLILRLIPWIMKADITHVHLFPALYWAGFANLLQGKRARIVYTEHSTRNRRRTNPILRRVDSFVYKHCYNRVIACADKALETFQQVYTGVKHVCAINNGVDTRIFREAAPYPKQELLGVSQDTFIVTMVARFMYMKRQDTIVEAIKKLPEMYHACFVGGEPNDEGLLRVRKMAEEFGISNRVHFLYLRSDVPRILKTSDVVIMSSEYEGLSLSSIEGMAAGKPFVATNVDGLREIVGGAGELFELYNSNELVSILLKLSQDKDYYEKVQKDCAIRASEYDLQLMVDKYMSLYSELVSE